MSAVGAYEQSTFSVVGARVRRLVLGIVLFVSLAVNVIFAICTLVNPVSLYAVLLLALILGAVGYLVEFTLADAEEVADAVMSDMHPALLRAPVCVSYEWVVGAWLAWWFITQLLWAADLVYQPSLVTSIVLVPLLLLYMLLRTLSRTRELWSSLESLLLLAIQLGSFGSLFFPTVEWAPQYIGVLRVCVRVVLFFVGVMLATFLEPPHWDVSLDDDDDGDDSSDTAARPVLSIERDVKRLMHSTVYDAESGLGAASAQRQRRFERARAMLAAHARTAAEHRRMRTTVALTAWVLVLPLRVVLFVYPLLLFTMIYDAAKAKRGRAIAPPPLLPTITAPPSPRHTAAVAARPSTPPSDSVVAESAPTNLLDKSRLRPAIPATAR
jgi:hypothetical protein